MGEVLTTLDLIVFFAALVGVMLVGLIAGRKETTSEDYFLAGRGIPWYGVAGSIFGSNVSANHMVGMMGLGFSIGFAQAHFELGAIFGLLALCYVFLPVYRKLEVYTLSEYLGRRYDNRSRLAYAIIMIIIMAFVQMVPGLYIGARTVCVLLGGDASQQQIVEERFVGSAIADFSLQQNVGVSEQDDATAAGQDGASETPTTGGGTNVVVKVNKAYYALFVILLGLIAAGYTIVGGLKAVVWTDVIQSVLLLVAGIGIAFLTYAMIGGWNEMLAIDSGPGGAQKMRLYLSSTHTKLPWTGVLTGLLAMHLYYWGTNQFIAQRALGARSDSEARLGIVAAGFLKLLIPFFSIGTGVAAFYLFQTKLAGRTIAPDTVFPELVKLVIPAGFGLIGIIAAGLIGAILSSIDSMMNSAATIVTVDIYKQYINPEASDRRLIAVGRISIGAFVVLAAVMAIFVLNPNSEENFFIVIVDYSSYLTPGLLVAFIMGMLWKRSTPVAGIVTILAGVVFSGALHFAYEHYHGMHPVVYSVASGERNLMNVKITELPEEMQTMELLQMQKAVSQAAKNVTPVNAFLGPTLNFFHRAIVVLLLCGVLHVLVSLLGKADPEKSRLVWTDLGGHAPDDLAKLLLSIVTSIVVFAALGWAMYREHLTPQLAAPIAAGWAILMYVPGIRSSLASRAGSGYSGNLLGAVLREDRLWAALLCALAVFMHFIFF